MNSWPLLTTKLHIPSPLVNAVARPRLMARLDEGLRLGQRLVLVAAPAGYGKTTLLADWIAGQHGQIGWLTLDEDDNDPIRFWDYFVAALCRAAAIAPDAPDALQSLQPPRLSDRMAALINQINQGKMASNLLIVLDDYHLISEQSVHDALTFLLEHQPANLRLILATRADPPLPIARLRARGQLTELRQADLCFTPQEAAEFLNRHMGLRLTTSDIAALDVRTEGWIAGLHMAALALQGNPDYYTGQFITTFTGTHRYILDYLIEEVLQREPPPIQAFLLQTSILERLCAPLCDAMLENTAHSCADSQITLEYLERSNLFIIPLDGQREWYRYHHLFSDLLRQRLRRTWPERIASLHRRAAGWYETQNQLPDAITHALAASDSAWASDLIERVAELTLMRGQVRTLLNWIGALPNQAIRTRPMLCVYHAWLLLLSGQPFEAVQARLQDVEQHANLIPGPAMALRAWLAALRMELTPAIDLAHQALTLLPQENVLLRSLMLWIVSAYALTDQEHDILTQILDQAAQTPQRRDHLMINIIALNQLADFCMRQGQLDRAQELYQRALEQATDAQGGYSLIAGQVLVGLGDLACERYDLDTAARYLEQGISLIEQWNRTGAIEAYISLARLEWARGQAGRTQDALDRARQLAAQFDLTEFDDWAVAMVQAQLWIAQDNLDAAQRWAQTRQLAPIETAWPQEQDMRPEHRLRKYELTVLARLLMAQGQPQTALSVLSAILPVAERQQRPALLIEIHLLRALALDALGRRQQALAALDRALELAQPQRYTRAFGSMGASLFPLLRLAAHGAQAAYATRLLTILGPESRSPESRSNTPPQPDHPAHMTTPALPEPLSEREGEVLRLLASALSTEEIAHKLYLSVHTVRSHIKSLYSKLNVHNRYQAIERARELDLL